MPGSHICHLCDKTFSAKPNLKRHIQNSHGKGQRVQCPYCNKTRTRVDDLIRYHIVNNHPEKVAKVAKDKTIIKTVSASNHSPEKKAKKENESSAAHRSTTKNKPERTQTEAIFEPLIGRPIFPLKSPPHNSDSIQGSPSLFQRLDNMITLAGGQVEVARQTETEQAVASILSTQPEAPMETSPQGDIEPPVNEKPDADILISPGSCDSHRNSNRTKGCASC